MRFGFYGYSCEDFCIGLGLVSIDFLGDYVAYFCYSALVVFTVLG